MKNMRQVCRVLLLLADEGPQTAEQLADRLNVKVESVRGSLKQLCTKQKVTRKQINKYGKNLYTYNENYTPPPRPKLVRCRTAVAKAMEEKQPVSFANCFMYAQQKVALLERLKNKVTDGDRDLIEGMINDYASRIPKAG